MDRLISLQAAIDAPVKMVSEGIEWIPVYHLKSLPSAQPEKRTEERTETHACDLISRQAAIDAILAVTGNSSVRELYEHVQEHGLSDMWSGGVNAAIDIIIAVPSAQPERLTDDDFETIRIHLNAYKEKLCNQQRWKEAEEYQRIIDRFMTFASAHPNLQPTCNELATDTISRQAAIDAIDKLSDEPIGYLEAAIDALVDLPSAQSELHYDEWCTDCKEYDHERHCCPRWNRVIRETLKDVQPEEDCDTCKHGYFGDDQCNNCRVRYPSHYERRTDD